MKRLLSSLLASFTKSSKSSKPLPQKRRARLGVECLEKREVMSGSPITHLTALLIASNYDYEVTVESTAGFPDPAKAPFNIQIDGEVMTVESQVAPSEWVVQRAVNGSPLQGHPLGDAVTLEGAAPAPTPGTLTWTGADSIYWNDPKNWSLGRVPINGDSLVFPASAKFFTSDDNIAGLSLRSIEFQGGGYTLLDDAFSLTSSIKNDSGSNTLLNPITLGGNNFIDVVAGSLKVGNTLTGQGDGSLTVLGTGTTILNGTSSSYTGGTTLQSGTLQVNNAGCLGTGPLTLKGGTLYSTSDLIFANQLIIADRLEIPRKGPGRGIHHDVGRRPRPRNRSRRPSASKDRSPIR